MTTPDEYKRIASELSECLTDAIAWFGDDKDIKTVRDLLQGLAKGELVERGEATKMTVYAMQLEAKLSHLSAAAEALCSDIERRWQGIGGHVPPEFARTLKELRNALMELES